MVLLLASVAGAGRPISQSQAPRPVATKRLVGHGSQVPPVVGRDELVGQARLKRVLGFAELFAAIKCDESRAIDVALCRKARLEITRVFAEAEIHGALRFPAD